MSNRITLTHSIRNIRTRFLKYLKYLVPLRFCKLKCYTPAFHFPSCESWGSWKRLGRSELCKQDWPRMEGQESRKKHYLHIDLLAAKRLCPWLGFIATSMIDIAPASIIMNMLLSPRKLHGSPPAKLALQCFERCI